MRTYTKKGFTIIELLIAIAIIVIIGGMILANYHLSRKQQTLQAEAQKLVSTLRQAQNMALAGETYPCDPSEPTKLEPQNYGVFLSTTNGNYKLFVDCDEGEDFDNEEELESTILPDNITMTILDGDCYIFTRPHGSLSGTGTESITLTLAGTGSKNISINKATGQISVD